ncbi:porin [Blattabacterium cuenoti]|uniref:porin n=1 Tax=Blattabacterium cuenoti TaxID=1653831 RepID=UPI00163B678A|nr:porin [Blattabacterium cuenoti]
MKKTKMISFILFLGFFYPFHSIYSYEDEGILHQKDEEISHQKDEEISHQKDEEISHQKDENSRFNMFVDFVSTINSTVKKESPERALFSEDHLTLEMIGKINDKISYRFVKKLNDIENYKTIDLAYLKYKWNDKLHFLIGKQPYSFGSIEYSNGLHESPYQYANVYKSSDNPIGFNFIYIPIKNHELQLQVVNSIKNPMGNTYNRDGDEVKKVNNPIGYSVSWNWNLNKIIQNRWSYSIFQENEDQKFWKFLALGSKVDLKPFFLEADYILSDEDIEKNGSITEVLRSLNSYYRNVASVKYGTCLFKLKYNFIPKWNLIVKGVYEIGTSKRGVNDILEEKKLFKKEYTYYGGIEFVPSINNDDLNFHLLYQNQRINYIVDPIQKENKNNHFIILGLSYRINML